ncbi:apolipoprotein A1/A4/E family protein [Bradyrhizobium sp. CCGB01]|uniref:apolipoprotein A1/A4/E family protein n=1 Tax=Bradyrhizobium sp. CCGB01 TaxID=2949634 RepID=UPI0020B3D676|nr:apolipoprotein A1/A4/E family protein [Bradyrhizobium sp. CCGB01]MCP3404462.1 apolipoprotein A1/A4/E family protein [Bradyrhizobium sp. CCGB01]
MVLAFRLYGFFQWPPLPDPPDHDVPPKLQAGMVEIHFDQLKTNPVNPTPEDLEYKAFLRWRPGTVQPDSGPAELPKKADNVYSIPEPSSRFNDADETLLWIFDPAKKGERKLAFRGAFLFEQYLDSAPKAPETVWPLVRECRYNTNEPTYFSTLIIGQSGNDNFRFDLQLPVPFPQTSRSAPGELNPATLPLSTVYLPRRKERTALTRINVLVMGASGRKRTRTFEQNEYFNVSAADRRLGLFGFSSGGNESSRGFAVCRGNFVNGHTPVLVKHFWPDPNLGNRVMETNFVLQILRRFGFRFHPEDFTGLALGSRDEKDLSIRFPRPLDEAEKSTEGNRRGSLVYRLAVATRSHGESDDLSWDADGFGFRLQEEIGGVLRIDSPKVFADVTLSWSIPTDKIWAKDRRSDWTLRHTLRFHWTETLGSGPLAARADLDESGDYHRGTLSEAAAAMTALQVALRQAEGGQPQSLLPNLSVDVDDQTVRFGLSLPAMELPDRTSTTPFDIEGLLLAGSDGPLRRPARLSLADARDLLPSETSSDLRLSATFPAFFLGEAQKRRLPLLLSTDREWVNSDIQFDPNQVRYFASFKMRWGQKPAKAKFAGRLSSLQFGFDTETVLHQSDGGTDESNRPDRLKTGGPGVRFAGRTGGARLVSKTPTAVSLSAKLGVEAIQPVGVDIPRSDRTGRPGPLLIPLGSEDEAAGFVLEFEEQLSATHDRLLTASIYDQNAETSGRDYVLLSQEPFSVLRFTEARIGARGDAANAAVAAYSSDDRIWTLKQVAEHYHYTLPPQVIGESADKPRRLHIHDLPEGTVAARRPVPPFDDDAPARDINHPEYDPKLWHDLHRRAVEFRLTPSTEIWVRPSDVERGYFMPAWESYELFRQRGEAGLGVRLAALRGEFLYGLAVGIDVAREGGVARQARVAEIQALTGSVLGEPRHDSAGALAKRWNALASAVSRRPERLEVWAFDPGSAVDFAPARFSDGVTFALRSTALHRAPVKGRNDEFESPAAYVNAPADKPIRFHPQGLSGGALWPVESANLFRALLERPESNGGSIEGIALSPLGGDAVQKAEFLNGIVSIISETKNGFVQRQQVEVIGRVGALWHRAKHVVIYERTTNPTAQFAPLYEDDPKGNRSRRPILRKVREYVEFIEWDRGYPDFPEAVSRSTGFLDRVRFNSRIINVDSAWSRDVGKFGWEIPLWNRASARQRPQVYPMPDVAFVTAAEGDGEKPAVAQETRDPEKLYFFADFSARTSDTNVWQVRQVVDYNNAPSSTNLAAIVDAKSTTDPLDASSRRPSVSRVLPGVSRFTWRLAPAARKSALNAGRSAKPVYVGLDSVTFMRSTQKIAEVPNDLKDVLKVKSAIGDPAAYAAIIGTGYWTSDGGAGPENVGAYTAAIKDVIDAAKAIKSPKEADLPPDLAPVRTAVQKLRAEITGQFQKEIAKKVGPAFEDAKKFSQSVKNVSALIGSGQQQCEKLKEDALAMVRGKSALIVENIRVWENDADTAVENAWRKLTGLTSGTEPTKTNLLQLLADDVIDLVRPVFTEASTDVGRGEEAVETARAIIADVDAEFESIVARARSRVREFAASYDRGKPWSPSRRASFQAGLYSAISSVADDVHGAIDEAQHRLGVELGNASQAIGGHLAKFLSGVGGAEAAALDQLSTIENLIDHLLAPVDSGLVELLKGNGVLDQAGQDIAKARTEVTNQIDDPKFQELKDAALGALRRADDGLVAVRSKADQAKQLSATANKLNKDTAASAVSGIRELAVKLDEIVKSIEPIVTELTEAAKKLSDAGFEQIDGLFHGIFAGIEVQVGVFGRWLARKIEIIGDKIDLLVKEVVDSLDLALRTIRTEVKEIGARVGPLADDAAKALKGIQDALAPNSLMEAVLRKKVIEPALDDLLKPLPESLKADTTALKELRQSAAERLTLLSTEVKDIVAGLKSDALDAITEISAFCSVIVEDANAVAKYFEDLKGDAETYVKKKFDELVDPLGKGLDDYAKDYKGLEKLVSSVQALDYTVRGIQNDLGRSVESARRYGDRVMDAFSKVDVSNPLAAPSNILKLYSAVTTAPEIAALKADIDRIRAGFDEASDIINTTRATALFNHLGDELKALGIALPFDAIGDKIRAVTDISSFDFPRVFSNLGGSSFGKLAKGFKMPAGAGDSIRLTHDFDKTQMKAWVQVDINLPVPGRCSLFSLEVFQADLVEMRVTGQVRLEASKDSETVSQTGFGRVDANLDMVVGGQSMVTFQSLAFHFTRESGLKVEFDPSRIKLNPSFQFIQDLLSSLFPDELGGLKVIKRDGIPVGLEHEFALPAISLMFGTSGVSNISISNRFQLLAYPDFIIADRFSLSRPEMPFIFSIFVIGGTGYIQIEAEYQPFRNDLMVSVEAAAGGSATLGLSFGPFSGSVFIALSISITYRKHIGRSGGGLTIGLVLVIAGSVTVCSIVTVGIYLLLRISYRDNGQADADGTLSVTISISRFFKIHARADVHYKLRGGRSETTVSTSVNAEAEDKRLQQAADKLKKARG